MARLLVAPRLRTLEDADDERHATWTELFFDLVFVVAVAELGALLHDEPTLTGALRCAGLFVPVWWAWVCFSVYADRFDTDDAVFRVSMLAAMLAVAALAVNVHLAAPGDSNGFVLSYAAVTLILFGLYERARRAAPAAAPLLTRYLQGFSLALVIWLVSLAFTGPARYVLWGVAMVIELGTPLTTPRAILRATPLHPGHLPERFGLFVLIVLGETVVTAISQSTRIDWTLAAAITAAASFAAAGCLWWVYFDLLDASQIRRGLVATRVYFNAHLPLVIALTMIGAGAQLAIAGASDADAAGPVRGFLLGGTALALLAMVALELAGEHHAGPQGIRARLGAATLLAVVAIAGAGIEPLVLVLVLAAVLVAELAVELRNWSSGEGDPPVGP
jgi:low temperature requirement protein LtrA